VRRPPARDKSTAQPPRFLTHWAFLNERAQAEIQAGNPDAAKSLYEQSNAITENPEALHEIALILMRKEQWKKARPYAERVIALAPDIAEGHQTLGAILYGLGEDAAAIPQFERALELDPKNQRALLNLARSSIAIGDLPRANETLDRARANDPADQRVGQGGQC
jgi:Flp pilus assembly protein TadD